MVWVEHAPQRYDWAVKLMTFGRIDQIKDEIAEKVSEGDEVLDIGCGTGTLALRCIRKGARVHGLDAAEYMLAQSDKNATAEGKRDQLKLYHDSITQTARHFHDEQFDMVTATMVLGEFPQEYMEYIFQECRRILKPGGKLVIADECWPRNPVIRLLYRMSMVVFWIPQFLFLRRPLFPIRDLDKIVSEADFTVADSRSYKGTSFRLVTGIKPKEQPRPPAEQVRGADDEPQLVQP
jgi:ubiquinone/menaquinone biosynthesis C-methylase UbiE